MLEDDTKHSAEHTLGHTPEHTPGALLSHARRAKKLSQEDVAKQLRLSVQWIKDIENNDYSHAPALIYVRGYLRAFARLVDVSTDLILGAFERLGLEEAFIRDHALDEKITKKVQTIPIISKSARVIIPRSVMRWASTAAFLILIIGVGIWWQGQKKHGIHNMNQAESVVVQEPKQDLVLPATTVPTAEPASTSLSVTKAATHNGNHDEDDSSDSGDE